MPANAGIQKGIVATLHSRLRGNDKTAAAISLEGALL
jgi:hypothetical protein